MQKCEIGLTLGSPVTMTSQFYIRKDGTADGVTIHQQKTDAMTMVEVIFAAANNYARNVETMGSQPRQFSY